jgi:hypothetical protein
VASFVVVRLKMRCCHLRPWSLSSFLAPNSLTTGRTASPEGYWSEKRLGNSSVWAWVDIFITRALLAFSTEHYLFNSVATRSCQMKREPSLQLNIQRAIDIRLEYIPRNPA